MKNWQKKEWKLFGRVVQAIAPTIIQERGVLSAGRDIARVAAGVVAETRVIGSEVQVINKQKTQSRDQRGRFA